MQIVMKDTKRRQTPHAWMTVVNFQGWEHPQYYCKCFIRFSFVQISIHLEAWQDVNFFLSFENLFRSRMVKRIIITIPRQVVKYIELLSWRLSHIIHQIFKMNLTHKGYINLDLEDILCLLNFLDEARYCILVLTHAFVHAVQKSLQEEFEIKERDLEIQYTLAKTCLQARRP